MVDIISNSRLATLDRCPRKEYWRYKRKLEPIAERVPLTFGRLFHQACKVYYDSGRKLDAARAFWDMESPGLPPDELRNTAKAYELLQVYDSQFQDEEWTDIAGETKFAIELQLANDLPPVTYRGIIDRVGTIGDNKLTFQEWKTTAAPWSFLPNPNHQITGYAYAMTQLFGEPVLQARVTLFGMFKGSKDGKRKHKDGSTSSVLTRMLVLRTARELEEWRQSVASKVRVLNLYEAQNFWPMNDSCNMYGKCEYADLCGSPPEVQEYLIKTAYRPIVEQEWGTEVSDEVS